MNRIEHTNSHNIRFYIEQACDFGDNGHVIAGRGWYAGLIQGKNDMSGIWFETKEAAQAAVSDYAVSP